MTHGFLCPASQRFWTVVQPREQLTEAHVGSWDHGFAQEDQREALKKPLSFSIGL